MIRAVAVMGTIVTIHVVDRQRDGQPGVADDQDEAIARALDWFARVEACCSRFDPNSELMQLSSQIGVAVPVSELLYQVVQFARAVAEETGGAFDPTVGREMETRGFNREHRTRQVVRTPLAAAGAVSYRDVDLDPAGRTVALRQPLILDLGAVAKGFAIDMAARELLPFRDFAVDAGGDLYLGGCGPTGALWSVGIRHPRRDGALIESLRVSNAAVCTSGDYERRGADPLQHHILDPRTGGSPEAIASVTVVAPTAMAADALATAVFVLGPQDGIALLERQAVEGLIVSTSLERYETRGMASAYACGG
jgi:thiamine biosynthesis lipoprotein